MALSIDQILGVAGDRHTQRAENGTHDARPPTTIGRFFQNVYERHFAPHD